MKSIAIGSLVAGLALAAACQDAPHPNSPALDETAGTQRVTVMTQNLYVGADLDAVIPALMSPDPTDDVPAWLGARATEDSTSFPARAGAVAAAIDKHRPDVVGLQEVSEIHVDLSGFGLPYAFDEDFLPILMDSLAARGLHYAVAGEVASLEAAPAPGVHLTDNDAILVNTDRASIEAQSGRVYTYNIGTVAPGVYMLSAFVTVAARIDGRVYWFASTHLEADVLGQYLNELRAAQAAELAAVFGDATPVFIMGDLNDDPGSLMYQAFQQAGFQDVWAELRPGALGYTNAHLLDLSDTIAPCDRRIDFIWARAMGHPGAGMQGQITRVGMLPSDRVDGPYYKIWASDHAGVVATLLVLPAEGVTP